MFVSALVAYLLRARIALVEAILEGLLVVRGEVETPGHIIWTSEGPPGTVRYGLKFDTTFDLRARLKELIDPFADEPSDA